MNKERYIKDVLKNIDASPQMKHRIKEDLYNRIDEAMENDPFFDVVESIGDPRDVAKEFSENLEDNVHIRVGFTGIKSSKSFEFKSEATLFGMPIVHINTGGRYTNRHAKGIIAIGDVATGVISLGGVAVGVISFGGIGIGVIGIGGVGLGVLAVGGVAAGVYALGAVAFGLSGALGAITRIFLGK